MPDEDGDGLLRVAVLQSGEDIRLARRPAGQQAEVPLRVQANLLNLTHDGIFVRDLNRIVTYWNRGAEELYGWPSELARGRAIRELLKTIYPVPLEEIEQEVIRAGRWEGELVHTKRDGTPVVVASRWSLQRDEAGAPLAILETNNDITERKLIQEKLKRSESYLAEAEKLTHTGSWARTPSEMLYCSEEMLRIWGFDPQDPLQTVKAFGSRIHPEDRDSVLNRHGEVLLYEDDSARDFRIVLPDGTLKHLHVIGHPALNERGGMVEYVGTCADVTERKRAEEERERLRQLEADLRHLNRVSVMGELAASLSHELKQPIAAAITNANTALRWLKRDPPDLEEARQATSRVLKDGTRATEIIERVRSFYTKGAPPVLELVDVNEVLREMPALLRNQADQHSIALRTDLAADVFKATADRVQLQQVLLNLMLNGIESMRDSGGELTVRSQVGPDGDLVISVSDTGVGLPDENTDQLFAAFFTTKPGGSGMGLTICRSIVEAHGGRLWATANPGRGATFHFTLPATAEAHG
jgi:PAS domain S-box-containing protein